MNLNDLSIAAAEIDLPIFVWIKDQHGSTYESIREAARILNIPRHEIQLILQRRRWSARGFHFYFDS